MMRRTWSWVKKGESSGTGVSLIDQDDNDYVLGEVKLEPLIHKLRKKYQVKLCILVRYVCKFMVPEDQKKERIRPVLEMTVSYDDQVYNLRLHLDGD